MLCLLCIVLAIWPVHTECTIATSKPSVQCPTWQYLSNNECVCGIAARGAVICNAIASTVHLAHDFCIFFSGKHNSSLVGSCPYNLFGGGVPKNLSQLRNFDGLCSHLHRKDRLCGECQESYSLPVYSYYLGCVKCENYKYGWLKFVTVAFLPLTIFYIIVILFRISATSSALNGYVLVSQLFANPTMLRNTYSYNPVSLHHKNTIISGKLSRTFVDMAIAVYAIWNLDFFCSFYKPICLHPDLKYQHVLLLDYAVAVYPLLLIFITFICVKLHDNFAIVVWLWRPFHRCLVRFRKQWNIQSYLVNALATFIVLSYVKILNVSFQFITSSHIFNMKGQTVIKTLWYYDGRVDMTSREYLPYLVLALCMLLIFNIFPLVLLAVYPIRYFQVFLSFCPCFKFKIALQIFMDAFHGCYKDTPHDYRHFAALYLAVRFLNLLVLCLCSSFESYMSTGVLVVICMLALIAKFQPYKSVKDNTIDIIMLLTLIVWFMMKVIEHTAGHAFTNLWFFVGRTLTAIVPPTYALYLIASHVFPTAAQCLKQGKKCVLKKIKKINADRQPLLNCEDANAYSDYNSGN